MGYNNKQTRHKMTNEQMKTLTDNGISTMLKYFEMMPNHPAKIKFYNAIQCGDMQTAFAVFQDFLIKLEQTTPDTVGLDYILQYWANK